MVTETQAPPRPRRDTAIPRRLLLLRREGDRLITTTPSASDAARDWTQTIPLAGAITCDCRGYQSHHHCWHAEEAERLRAEYLAIRAVQAGLSRRTLLQTAEATHPDNLRHPFAGAVTLTWLAAMQSLEERGALGKAVAA